MEEEISKLRADYRELEGFYLDLTELVNRDVHAVWAIDLLRAQSKVNDELLRIDRRIDLLERQVRHGVEAIN